MPCIANGSPSTSMHTSSSSQKPSSPPNSLSLSRTMGIPSHHHPPLPLLVFLAIFSISLLHTPSQSYTDSFLYGGCSQVKYTPGSPYESNLDSLLTSLVKSATYSSYNKFTVLGSTQQDAVYGLFQCRGDLSMPECATCIARAVTQAGVLCPFACGGAVQLQGCYVKYDNSTFLGVEDKSVLLRKCGPSDSSADGPATVMGERNAVLAGLEGASGPYRAGGSGKVLGLAQCVGDLSVGQCQDCLSEAIRRLRSECGVGVYGDMFLGKCYARYSTKGAQMFSTKSGNNSGKSNDKGTKTFAIIVGMLGVVALLIIFLTFIRKVCQGSGK